MLQDKRVPRVRMHAFMLLCATLLALVSTTAKTQALEQVRIGYLQVAPVDGPIWIMIKKGYLKEQGIELVPVKLTTGLAAMQALGGGSLEIACLGGALANLGPRGLGKVFLIHAFELSTGRAYGWPDMGVSSVKDLQGKRVAFPKGTTAHIHLSLALKSAGLSESDITPVNMDTASATTAFISRSVPATVIWTPFNLQIKKNAPGAKEIFNAKDLKGHSILDGCAANNEFHAKKRDTLVRYTKAWMKANEFIASNPKEAMELVYQTNYADLSKEDYEEGYNAAVYYPNPKWVDFFRDGTVAGWLENTQRQFIELSGSGPFVPASKFFDHSILLDAAKR